MKKAALDAVSGGTTAVDVGRFGEDRYFVYVAAFGAFTEVSYSTPQEAKNLLGHQAYMLEAVKRVTNLKAYRMKFEWEDKVLEDEFIIGMITNTISIGGFKGLVGLDVALDDGEFEVLLVRKPRTPKDIASIASYLILREGRERLRISVPGQNFESDFPRAGRLVARRRVRRQQNGNSDRKQEPGGVDSAPGVVCCRSFVKN